MHLAPQPTTSLTIFLLKEGSAASHSAPVSSKLLLKASITVNNLVQELAVFVYIGADLEFLDKELACQLGIETEPLPLALQVRALDGYVLHPAHRLTKLLRVAITELHQEWQSFLVTSCSAPESQFQLRSSKSPFQGSVPSPLTTMIWVWSLVRLEPPCCLHTAFQLCHQSPAWHLTPTRLSLPPDGARDGSHEHLHLQVSIIRPSLSPARAGFFFIEKKDKTLHPCIDYWGLNAIMVKNCYPFPLVSSAFELLQGATVFTKLNLWNAFHLIRIREGNEWKIAFNTLTMTL
ncbi:hypothetical protein QTP86_016121 [Hemibagrus guttatus]|nr:hypothetical protein QTP86_016121 [Hemibagrus guttatus]